MSNTPEGSDGEQEEEKPVNLPFGIDKSQLQDNSLDGINVERLKQQNLKKKKNPFQAHKQAKQRKKLEEEAQAKAVLEESLKYFTDDTPAGQTFVRGGTIVQTDTKQIEVKGNASEYKLDATGSQKKSKPKSAGLRENAFSTMVANSIKTPKRKKEAKKTRVIDTLVDELKRTQELREKQKELYKKIGRAAMDSEGSNYDDPASCNLYLSNLSQEVTDEMLYKVFRRYGQIASIKIMWPRNDDPDRPRRTKNTGFINFTTRHDAEGAKRAIDGTILCGSDIRIGWGRSIPARGRIYVPPSLQGQHGHTSHHTPIRQARQPAPQAASAPVSLPPNIPQIRVQVPSLGSKEIIDALAQQIIQHGFRFEQYLCEKVAQQQPELSFLFQYGSPDNMYYRWRVYSLYQGDTLTKWRTSPFQMFSGGAFWIPPPPPLDSSTSSQAANSVTTATDYELQGAEFFRKYDGRYKPLSDEERDILTDALRDLTMSRKRIKSLMGFCIDHSESAPEIVQVITDSLLLLKTSLSLKLSRLFLISDVLHNSSVKAGASLFRTGFQETLPQILESFNKRWRSIVGRMTANNLQDQITQIIKIWENWELYPQKITDQFKKVFMNKEPKSVIKFIPPLGVKMSAYKPYLNRPLFSEEKEQQAPPPRPIIDVPMPQAPPVQPKTK